MTTKSDILEEGKNRIGLNLKSMPCVARRYPSTTPKMDLQAEMYIMEHYHGRSNLNFDTVVYGDISLVLGNTNL